MLKNIKNIINKGNLFRLVYLFLISLVLVQIPVSAVSALDQTTLDALDNNWTQWVPNSEFVACPTNGGTLAAGTGSPTGAQFPNLDPNSMASAINEWITQQNPNSALSGLGSTIVASANNSNINPFLIVAIAKEETSLADTGSYNVKFANNPFSREATASQPNFPGAGPNAGTLWYKWSSVKASVDFTAPENQNAPGGGDIASYLKDQFPSELASGSLLALFLKYAPPGPNNPAQYSANVTSWISQMAALASGTTGAGTTAATTTPTTESTCCPLNASATSITALVGSTNTQQAYNYFVTQGLTPAQSAGIVGNLIQESGVNPTETNGIGAHGIAQWTAGRLAALVAFASANAVPEDALSTQLNFVWQELNSDYLSVLNSIKGSSDVTAITGIVFNNYERAGDNSLPARIIDAEQVLAQYGGSTASTTSAASGTTTMSTTCGGTTSSTMGYQNPFRDIKNLVPERIDQGVDYSGTGPIYAIGDGIVTGVFPDWYLTEPLIAYTLTDGAAQGKVVYIAECITPSVTKGEQVTSNTVIAQMINCGNGIETGWANPAMLPDSMARFCWDGVSSSFGANFSQFLKSIGAPPGITQEANPPCVLPAGWPTW